MEPVLRIFLPIFVLLIVASFVVNSSAQKGDRKSSVQKNQKETTSPALLKSGEKKNNSKKPSQLDLATVSSTKNVERKFTGPSGLHGLKAWHEYGAFSLYRTSDVSYSSLTEDVRHRLMPAEDMNRILIDAFSFDTQREEVQFPSRLNSQSYRLCSSYGSVRWTN